MGFGMKTTAGHSNRVFSSKFKQDDPVRYNHSDIFKLSRSLRHASTLFFFPFCPFSFPSWHSPSLTNFFLLYLLYQCDLVPFSSSFYMTYFAVPLFPFFHYFSSIYLMPFLLRITNSYPISLLPSII